MSSTKIDKLNHSNYHFWKIRIEHILALKDLENFLIDDPPSGENVMPTETTQWKRKDKKAQAIIGLTLSDDLLENVREVKTAKEMWQAIKNVFERHTLLNKLAARRKFYTATKNESESVLQFANRIRQLSATLATMNVTISESEKAMALLNGLPDEYRALISALDAVDSDESEFKWEHVKSRVLQEEQRISMRVTSAQKRAETAALLSNVPLPATNRPNRHPRNCPYCNFCKRPGHYEHKWYTKFPHLIPRKGDSPKNPAFIANNSDDDPVVCLMAKYDSTNEPKHSDKWYVDSGCSNHMTFNKSLFSSYTPGLHSTVKLGNSNTSVVSGIGTVDINICVDGKQVKCRLHNVYHVPELGYQLISVPTFDKSGLNTTFHSRRCWIRKENTLLATATMKGNLYELDICSPSPAKALVAQSTKIWHQRLAHIQPSSITGMAKSNAVWGLEINNSQELTCTGCVLGKGHRQLIPKKSHSRSTKLLELVHSDVNGPLEVPSLGGSRYFVTFIDDYSRWISLYTMKAKSETFDCFKRCHAMAERHTGSKIESFNIIRRTRKTAEKLKTLRTDNGGEYLSNDFRSYLQEHGIQHQLTIAYTPQQNGVAERMNRTLVDCVRSLLHTAQLEKKFWAEALSTVVYVRNRVISRSLPKNITPYHLWMRKAPDLSHLRVFGSKCWYVLPKKKVKKLDARSKEGLMMGYSSQSKGYKILDLESSTLIVSRDVTFDESSVDSPTTEISDKDGNASNVAIPGGDVKAEVADNVDLNPEHRVEPVQDTLDNNESGDGSDSDGEFEDAQETPDPPLRRSTRNRKPVGEWWKSGNASSHVFVVQDVPTSYKNATTPDNISFWQPGIDREHDCLHRNGTWELIDYSHGMKVLPCKYVFKVKENKPKVRLVALGCRQMHGIDYNETFAPVVTITTIRTILAVTAHQDLELQQMDVVTAFLNGDLEEDIYMAVPEGLKTNATSNKVCKLLKSLYGLKQSPRQWYFKMHKFLIKIGFTSSSNDPCLYIRHLSSGIVLTALYVDDLLIAGSSSTEVQSIKDKLSHGFEMKNMGEAKVILGIEISRDRSTRRLFINQSDYTQNVLERFGMSNSKPVVTPMDRSYHDVTPENAKSADDVPYRQTIGSLMYLMITTRPDISYAIGKLSQHNQNPRHHDWIAVKRVLRYISGTRHFGILYDGSKSLAIDGFSDADWGGCKVSRKSTSGAIFLVAGGAVSRRSKKQTCVATSTCEAEYIASCLAAKESIWLARLLADLQNHEKPGKVHIKVDNEGTIDTANNTSINQRNKHIDLQYHFVRDSVQSNLIQLDYCESSKQLADSFTKPLDRILFEKLRTMQGLCPKPF